MFSVRVSCLYEMFVTCFFIVPFEQVYCKNYHWIQIALKTFWVLYNFTPFRGWCRMHDKQVIKNGRCMWRPILLGCLLQCSTKCAERSRWSRPSSHFLGVTLWQKTPFDLGEEILVLEWLRSSRVFSTYVLNAWCCSPKRSDTQLTKGRQTALWGCEISACYGKAVLPSKVERIADPSGRAVWGVGLRPLAGWDCGFEFGWGDECVSLWTLCVVR